jgi:hypothetical protein
MSDPNPESLVYSSLPLFLICVIFLTVRELAPFIYNHLLICSVLVLVVELCDPEIHMLKF